MYEAIIVHNHDAMVKYLGQVGRPGRPNRLDRRGDRGDQGGMVMIPSYRLNRLVRRGG